MRVCDKCGKTLKEGWANMFKLGNNDEGELCDDCKSELKLIILKWKKGELK